jgi:hypothetical protein
MVDRSEQLIKRYPAGRALEKIAEFGEVEISQNDTVTFSSFHASKALLNVVFWKKTDGSAVTNTIALNVATVTGAGTNMDCLYLAYGYKV